MTEVIYNIHTCLTHQNHSQIQHNFHRLLQIRWHHCNPIPSHRQIQKKVDELDDILASDDNISKLSQSQLVSPPKSRDTTPIRQFKKVFSDIYNPLDDISITKTINDNYTLLHSSKTSRVFTKILSTVFTQ